MLSSFLSALIVVIGLFSVSGTVTDANDRSPLSEAVVSVEKDGRTVKWGVSDNYGRYSIKGLSEGNYTERFSYVGYKAASREIYLSRDLEISQRIVH